jgi:hypothetical protein
MDVGNVRLSCEFPRVYADHGKHGKLSSQVSHAYSPALTSSTMIFFPWIFGKLYAYMGNVKSRIASHPIQMFPTGKLVGKKRVDPDEVAGLVGEGWSFRIKVVKGRRYITVRRGRSERSLGPYSEELWTHIQRLREEDTRARSVSSPEADVSGLGDVGKLDLLVILDRVHDKIQSDRGAHMPFQCLFRGGDGYCEYWVWSNELPFMDEVRRHFGEDTFRRVYDEASGTERWVTRAIGFTCKGCPAFLDERMIELFNSRRQGRGGLTNLPSSH